MNPTLAPTKASTAPEFRTSASESETTQEPQDRLRGRRPESWYDSVALAVLATAAAVLSVWNINGATVYRDDEGTYTAQAFSVLQGNLAPYAYGYDHPPLGWIQIAALAWIPNVLGLGDGTYIGATRYAMAPFFVATAVLIYLIARRLQIRWPLAALAVLVFILSPLSLVFGRQVFLDNIGLPWLLLAFWMALSPRAALWHHVWAGAFFAVAVLSKETLAIFGPALMVALLNRPSWTNRKFSVIGFLTVGGLLLGFYPLTALLRGELVAGPERLSLQQGLAYQFLDRSGSGAFWDPDSGRAELVDGWLYYDQYLIGAGLIAGLVCLLRRRTAWIPLALASFAVPVVLGQGYLPGMYIIAALPFLALAIGAGLDILWGRLEKLTAPRPAHVQRLARGLGAAGIAVGVAIMSGPQWFGQDKALLTQQTNDNWALTLTWIQENVPQDDTVLVPYSLWQDLNPHGQENPWTVVATEKADLDPQFLREHPEGPAAIDWIVVGPDTRKSIDIHNLSMAGEALENSVPVQTFGAWSVHRVQGL